MAIIHENDAKKLAQPTMYQGRSKHGYISYAAHLRAYAIYSMIYGTEQSADRIAERHGFGEGELDEFYPEWRNHIIEPKY